MAVFLLEFREDEETQANFPSKEAFSPIFKTMVSCTNGAILRGNLMVSNNIIIALQ